ncbi:MAG: hypothetical protein JXA89_15085 [Anaerolineae bacterium]|nr:hypothetical protein [Anaerolineae bacterium]
MRSIKGYCLLRLRMIQTAYERAADRPAFNRNAGRWDRLTYLPLVVR